MSTEIKNTLFRFVSMRAPELSSDIEKNPAFIVKDENIKLFCEDVVTAVGPKGSKLNALKTAATTFATPINNVFKVKNADNIKAISSDLYKFSEWLSKNRNKATEAEIKAKADTTVLKNVSVVMKDLWDNLVYQVITQNDYYAKELLMQYLLALHVIKNTTSGTYKERALAKVVLPENLFVENPIDETPAVAPVVKEVLFPNQLFQALDKQALAEQNIAVLNTLHDELEAAELEFKANYQAPYSTALEDYKADPDNVALLDQYETDLEDAKTRWLATKDKAIVFNPADPSHQIPSVRLPKLPKFKFVFQEEMNTTFLSGFLSTDSYAAYQRLIQTADDDADDEDEIDVFKTTAAFRKCCLQKELSALQKQL